DAKNKGKILDILFKVNREQGQTLIVVTHDTQILDGFERTIDFQEFTVDSVAGASTGNTQGAEQS
ncbi:MAG: hypothetical protein VYE64_05585, partial [Planctomycetota bacterium]|nr:hypothetical protein [Planctomycetota bacterium]